MQVSILSGKNLYTPGKLSIKFEVCGFHSFGAIGNGEILQGVTHLDATSGSGIHMKPCKVMQHFTFSRQNQHEHMSSRFTNRGYIPIPRGFERVRAPT